MTLDQTTKKAGLWSIAEKQAAQRAPLEGYFVGMLLRYWGVVFKKRIYTVLDVPCGLGRHDGALREQGFDVYGIDIESDFIKKARESYPKSKDRYEIGDMRKLPYKSNSFDGVVNLFTSLGCFGEAGSRKAIKEFSRVLKKGGLLVINYRSKESLKAQMQKYYVDEVGDKVIRLVENSMNGDFWIMDQTLLEEVRNGYKKIGKRKVKTRLYSVGEWRELCKSAGLEVVATYSGYSIIPLTNTDRQIMLVARKK
jgi:ubiquinone/menaquinone biosynthesis C-methylase UbiE